MATLQVLTLLFLPALALGCSCPFPPPSSNESEYITGAFCNPYIREIFIAEVAGATCTCSDLPFDRSTFQFPPNTTYSCARIEVDYTSSNTVQLETIARTTCRVPGYNPGIVTCEELNAQTAASMPLLIMHINRCACRIVLQA